MVEIIKDERKVIIENGDVIFTYENKQKYTPEQARNIYINFLRDLKSKEGILNKFDDILKTAEEEYDKTLDLQVEQIKQISPNMSFVDINYWKKVSKIINTANIKNQIQGLKDDLVNIKEGIEIWNVCKDLPETDYEKKLKENNEI